MLSSTVGGLSVFEPALAFFFADDGFDDVFDCAAGWVIYVFFLRFAGFLITTRTAMPSNPTKPSFRKSPRHYS